MHAGSLTNLHLKLTSVYIATKTIINWVKNKCLWQIHCLSLSCKRIRNRRFYSAAFGISLSHTTSYIVYPIWCDIYLSSFTRCGSRGVLDTCDSEMEICCYIWRPATDMFTNAMALFIRCCLSVLQSLRFFSRGFFFVFWKICPHMLCSYTGLGCPFYSSPPSSCGFELIFTTFSFCHFPSTPNASSIHSLPLTLSLTLCSPITTHTLLLFVSKYIEIAHTHGHSLHYVHLYL